MVGLLTACLILGGPVDVQASTLDDQSVQGKFVALTEGGQLVVETTDGRQELPQERLLGVQFDNKVALLPSYTLVGLVDGSELLASQFTVTKDQATITLHNGGSVAAPTRAIEFVRFNHAKRASEDDWNSAISESAEAVGDVIVVRKVVTPEGDSSNAPKSITLRNITGLFYDVTDETVKFKFDDNLLDVSREKVEGLVYYHPERELPHRLCQVTDRTGSIWMAKTISTDGGEVKLTTTSGVTRRLPIESVHKLSFAEGKVVYLGEIEPQSVRWQPLIGSTLELLEKLNLPRMNETFDGNPLVLPVDGVNREFPKGMAVRSRTELSYRLPSEFRRFVATVGIDPQRGGKGNVRLLITGNGRTLLDEEVTASGASSRVIEIPMTGISRFAVLVDYGQSQDIADHLLICNPRFEK